jgi:hypothetical protein
MPRSPPRGSRHTRHIRRRPTRMPAGRSSADG